MAGDDKKLNQFVAKEIATSKTYVCTFKNYQIGQKVNLSTVKEKA